MGLSQEFESRSDLVPTILSDVGSGYRIIANIFQEGKFRITNPVSNAIKYVVHRKYRFVEIAWRVDAKLLLQSNWHFLRGGNLLMMSISHSKLYWLLYCLHVINSLNVKFFTFAWALQTTYNIKFSACTYTWVTPTSVAGTAAGTYTRSVGAPLELSMTINDDIENTDTNVWNLDGVSLGSFIIAAVNLSDFISSRL